MVCNLYKGVYKFVCVSGVQQDPQLAYSLGQMGPAVDPYYAMASMYPPGSRERSVVIIKNVVRSLV